MELTEHIRRDQETVEERGADGEIQSKRTRTASKCEAEDCQRTEDQTESQTVHFTLVALHNDRHHRAAAVQLRQKSDTAER